jgi:hypothetical protein
MPEGIPICRLRRIDATEDHHADSSSDSGDRHFAGFLVRVLTTDPNGMEDGATDAVTLR